MYRDHRKGPGGSTGWGHLYRRAPWAEVGGEPAPGGLVLPPLGPLRLGLETLGVGAPPLGLGGKPPPWPPPPLEIASPRAGAPLGVLYIVGGGRAAAPKSLAPPSPLVTPLSLIGAWRSITEITAASITMMSCCWISINLFFPLLDQEGGDVFPNRMCVERGGAVRSALGHR